jgi:alpha-glucosidase (family GH31 glycosyl hydrolase)
MRQVVSIRYSLLPYLYTLFYYSHVEGRTVVRPLFFEFLNDSTTFSIDRQFMFGSALMITPVLESGVRSVKAYMPNDTWYDYYSGARMLNNSYVDLEAPIDKINIHLRGGHIVPIQYPNSTTKASRRNPFSLLIALKYSRLGVSYAEGKLYWDDGESFESIRKDEYNLFDLRVHDDELRIRQIRADYKDGASPMILSDIKIFGVKQTPKHVRINKELFNNFTFDDANGVLKIEYFKIDLIKCANVTISWSQSQQAN